MEARVLFKLSHEEKAMLERLAEMEDRSVSNLLRHWIRRETRKMEKEEK